MGERSANTDAPSAIGAVDPNQGAGACETPLKHRTQSVTTAHGISLMALSAMGFALVNACVKEASASLPVSEVVFLRSLVGCIAVALYARARKLPLRVSHPRLLALRVGSGSVAMMLTFYALAKAPFAEATTLLNLTPLFVAGFAALCLRERLESSVGLGLILSTLGVLLIFQPQMHGLAIGQGELAAFFAAIITAIALVSLRRLSGTQRPEGIVFYLLLSCSLITAVFFGSSFRWPSMHGAFFSLAAGAFGTLAQLAQTRAYAVEKAARLGAMNYANIVISIMISIFVFHEKVGLSAKIGIGLILTTGGILVGSVLQHPARTRWIPKTISLLRKGTIRFVYPKETPLVLRVRLSLSND